MAKKKDSKFQITEIFVAKAGKDWNRRFHGTLNREKDENGKECLVRGKIFIKTATQDGFVLSTAKDEWELGKNLDELVWLVLDFALHDYDKKDLIICAIPVVMS